MKTFIIAALLLSSALYAGMGRNMPTFSDFDTNGDGKITQAEFESTQQKRMSEKAEMGKMMRNAGNAPSFKDIDTDHNGYLDAAEFSHHQMMQRGNKPGMGMQGKGMQGMDMKGGMGMGRNMRSFDDIDTNGDGMISREEFKAHQMMQRDKMMNNMGQGKNQ